MNVEREKYLRLLEFDERWLRLGLLTGEELAALGHEYESGGDENTGHYRYRVFVKFLAAHRPLSPLLAEALYELGGDDPDPALGGAMMRDIVDLAECPDEVLDKASASGRGHLVKAVRRKRLLAELNSGLTEELFARCLESRDAPMQRELLERGG